MTHRNRYIGSAFSALTFVVCLAVGLMAPGVADAGFLSDFTGYTQLGTGSSNGIVDFTVYQNDGSHSGDWTQQISGLGAISGINNPANGNTTIDTTAQYVFFYQVVDTVGTVNSLNVNSYSTPYTSGGWLSQVFNDGNPIGPSGNLYIGTEAGSFTPDPVTSSPTESGLSLATPFVTTSSLPSPTAPFNVNSLGGAGGGGSATFLWLTGLTPGQFSPVLILTSNTSPTYSAGSISPFAGTPSTGGIPTQAPEPTTLAMWGLGMLGLAFVAQRRKQRLTVSA